MSAEALVIHDLVYRWPRQRAACLDIPGLSVATGERVFLHGPSGSGKSSLLGVLGGVALPERGRVTLFGAAITALGGRARDAFRADHIGFIFQQFNLLPWLSACDNVLLPCTFSARRKRRAGDPVAEAARLLSALDLARELWHQPAGELSVGQQQRVAAARALIGRPELLIADEPTSALDAPRQQAFIDLLLGEAGAAGATLLFVSHDARLAAHFDRVLALTEINRAADGSAA
ncbi:ABC transporter ATP-binding protein [Accumulibacter sp.]|uniref:ABC transporter ATP-binding protein n=1 Tax=Accumulibacter sp. TaxID=2053492 RepID=UPI0026137620|nr:ABC transporter ATP-binding protein [Accumulibacter sp.]MDS4054043.1 ABC transporter ATP-binding protein [Accumulibacter sp.]HNC26677.1 ABC transporter ATP-binding protein [Accumulibacter sp.]HNI49966.1 ABC transporter ATP-binding protein [Accumulibacter sp.]HNM63445.1 ABC transporter ATP-binding protein [Accumulibacter sp.]